MNYESTVAGNWTECTLCFIGCTRVQTAECKELAVLQKSAVVSDNFICHWDKEIKVFGFSATWFEKNKSYQNVTRQGAELQQFRRAALVQLCAWDSGTVAQWHVWRRWERHTGFWWGNLEERGHFEDVGVDGMIILTWILKKYDEMSWNGLIWLRTEKSGKQLWSLRPSGMLRSVGSYRRFGTAYQSNIHQSSSLGRRVFHGPQSPNVGNYANNQRCVTSEKSRDPIYTSGKTEITQAVVKNKCGASREKLCGI